MSESGWVKGVTRWEQVNLKENNPLTLDVDFWVGYWQRTKTQGVTANSGMASLTILFLAA